MLKGLEATQALSTIENLLQNTFREPFRRALRDYFTEKRGA